MPDAPMMRVLYASQTGNADLVAEDTLDALTKAGVDARLDGLDDVDLDEIAAMDRVAVVCSTTGDGDVPDDAEGFWAAVSDDGAPSLGSVTYAVCALGDSGYPRFCNAGRMIDERFAELGATRLLERTDCDADFDATARDWIDRLVAAVTEGPAPDPPPAARDPAGSVDAGPRWCRDAPFPAVLATSRRLSGPGSTKDVRHHEIALAGSGLEYAAGDGLAVVPGNDPGLVAALLEHLAPVDDAELRDTLAGCELGLPSPGLLVELARRTADATLGSVLGGDDRRAREAFLRERDLLDVLRAAGVGLTADELVGLLDPLAHRTYSIASSPTVSPDHIHLTVSTVRYGGDDRDGRERGGVCSTHLADRIAEGDTAGVFLLRNTAFRPPPADAPLIMIGPGTGVAPFRAFLQERRATGARGRNWLFFGDRHSEHDFLYGDELTAMHDDGLLTRLDLAFSRDQARKVYVQHRMREHGAELYAWLADGARVYVCGDAERMAPDVDTALHEIVAEHGGLDADGAAGYVKDLKREKRYLLDVY